MTVPEKEQATGTDVAALDIGATSSWRVRRRPATSTGTAARSRSGSSARQPNESQTSKQSFLKVGTREADTAALSEAHAVNALLRDLVERLHNDGVETIYYGDLTGVLGEYWSVGANLKARSFWAHRQCLDQLTNVCEEYGLEVASLSEAWTSQTCPVCGEREQTCRHRETLTCPCGFEGHTDLVASQTLLEQATNTDVRPTARLVRFQWDDHQWYPVEGAAVAPND